MKPCHPFWPVLLCLSWLTATPRVAPLSTEVLDFEEEGWTGIETVSEPVKHGRMAGQWAAHGRVGEVFTERIPHDWSAYGQLRFQLYSATNNGATAFVILESRARADDFSYYSCRVTIDWKGWKEVVLPFYRFAPSRTPVGWQKIDRLRLTVSGWGALPLSDSDWVLDHFTLAGIPEATPDLPPAPPGAVRFMGHPDFTPGLVERIEPFVTDYPAALGPHPTNRSYWDAMGTNGFFANLLAQAEDERGRPSPRYTSNLVEKYLAGDTAPFNDMNSRRITRLNLFAFSEAILNDGRNLKALEETLESFLTPADSMWANPVHTGLDRRQFYGEVPNVDLEASHRAMMLALCAHWYGDRMTPGLVGRIKADIKRRIWDPYREAIRTNSVGLKQFFWVPGDANWNPVCHSGVIGSALLLEKDRRFRAEMIACGETWLPRYLRGFFEDGYSPEGIAYWNYGFSHYLLLATLIERSTGGRLRHFGEPKVQAVMQSGRNLAIAPGQFPAFGDAGGEASPMLNWQIDRLNGLTKDTAIPWEPVDGRFYPWFALLLESGKPTPDRAAAGAALAPRSWFEDAQVFVGRSGNPMGSGLGFAVKAGANAGNHHHIDNGSFTVQSGGGMAVGDPGADNYVYNLPKGRSDMESQLKNSYGHPVPLVAGRGQFDGADARAEVVAVSTNDLLDEVTLDLTASYRVPELLHVTRRLRLDRTGAGTLTVQDDFAFTSPQAFGTALMARMVPSPAEGGAVHVGMGSARLRVRASGAAGALVHDVNTNLTTWGRKGDVRIGWDIPGSAKAGWVRLEITPDPAPNEIILDSVAKAGTLRPVKILGPPNLLTTHPERLFNGDLIEAWESGGSPSFTLDFGRPVTLAKVGICHPLKAGRRYRLSIEASGDGTNWLPPRLLVTSGLQTNLEYHEVELTAPNRFLRVTGLGNTSSAWNAWTELEFMGR